MRMGAGVIRIISAKESVETILAEYVLHFIKRKIYYVGQKVNDYSKNFLNIF